MGNSKDYSNVAEWKTKDTGYHTGDMVRYKNNIFRAAYWAGKEPGVDPGWSLYDELYDQTSANPTTTAKIIGYLPTWRTDLDFGNAMMYQNITHGIIAFLNFDENHLGELDQTSVKAVTAIVQQVVTAAHQAGTYISVAIGGAVDYGFLNLLTAVGSNASDARLDKAVQNVAQFVKDNALDGVDLDLECWWDKNGDASKDQGGRDKSKGAHPAGSAQVTFAQKLKAAMSGKLVSATTFATSWYGNSYDPKLADYVDWLSIMSYDLTGSWNQTPVGPHTALYKIRKQDQYKDEQQGSWPLTARGPSNNSTPMDDNPIFSVEDSLWYWSNPFFVNWQGTGQKVARNKLVAGVPLYGYDFAYKKDPDPESGQTPTGYKVLRYKELVQQFSGASTAANANIKVSGNTPRPSFVSAAGTYPYAHNIYLETPDTAVTKLKFLSQLGLQGVIIWEMSNEVWDDGKSVVKALYQASGNPATRPALPVPVFANPDPVSLSGLNDGDQSAWSADAHLPNDSGPYGATGGVALAVFKDRLYCMHRGGGSGNDSGHLWVASFDDTSWSDDRNLEFGAQSAPALAVYNDVLWCVHQGSGADSNLWVTTTSDGKSWATDETILASGNKIPAAGPPALAVFQDQLWCIFQGIEAGERAGLLYTTYNANRKSWIDPTALPVSVKAGGPAAVAVYDGDLWCVFQGSAASGQGDDQNLWYAVIAPNKGKGGVYASDEGQLKTGQDGKGIVGAKDIPALVVYKNALWCVHRGGGQGNDSGYLWFTYRFEGAWSTDQKIKTEGSGDVGAFAPPALAVNKDQLYCVHPGGGNDPGHLWYTTSPPKAPDANQPEADSDAWLEAHGDNSYCYYAIDNLATGGQLVSATKTIKLEDGAPYLYAVLFTGQDSADFPTGVSLAIKGPGNPRLGPVGQYTYYDQDVTTDSLVVRMSGTSLRSLVVENPTAGNWIVTLRVPKDTAFRFEFATAPANDDTYDTIDRALSAAYQTAQGKQILAKRDAQNVGLAVTQTGLMGAGVTAIIYVAEEAVAVTVPPIAVIGVLTVLVANALWYIFGDDSGTSSRSRPPREYSSDLFSKADWAKGIKQLLRDRTPDYSQFKLSIGQIKGATLATLEPGEKSSRDVGHLRVATWNVGNAFSLGGVPLTSAYAPFRMALFSLFATAIGIDIVAFQEAPNNLGDLELLAIANYGYQYQYLQSEYPPRVPGAARTNRNDRAKGYLVLYRPDVLTVTSQIDFFQADQFQSSLYQFRPPARINFQVRQAGNQFVNRNISFLTWHNETAANGANDLVVRLSTLVNGAQDWIIVGDFNTPNVDEIDDRPVFSRFAALSGGTTAEPDGNKDHILMSNSLVVRNNWREVKFGPTFASDSGHLALIVDIGS
jgi:GH18 family chitinase